MCGALGTILTGFFATGISTMKGVFYGGGFKFLGIQFLGVGSTIVWTAVVITLVFSIIKKTIGLRADASDEETGGSLALLGTLYCLIFSKSRGSIVFLLYFVCLCFLTVFHLDRVLFQALQWPQISQIKAMRKQSTC